MEKVSICRTSELQPFDNGHACAACCKHTHLPCLDLDDTNTLCIHSPSAHHQKPTRLSEYNT